MRKNLKMLLLVSLIVPAMACGSKDEEEAVIDSETVTEETDSGPPTETDTAIPCIDDDEDSFGAGCAAGPDCDDSNPQAHALLQGYVDVDQDGVGAGDSVKICAGAVLPAPFAETGDDCDDENSDVYQLLNGYADSDMDNLGSGTPREICSAEILPEGFTESDPTDCDDTSDALYHIMNGFVDADEDGVGTGSLVSVCTGESLPSGYVETGSPATDCDDSNAAVQETVTGVIDRDGDGYGDDNAEPIDLCTDGTLPSGYTAVAGDCDDTSPDKWSDCAAGDCIDADGDYFYAAGCSNKMLPGPDCDDSDPMIYPGRQELVNNGIDDNCNGADLYPGETTNDGTDTGTIDSLGVFVATWGDDANDGRMATPVRTVTRGVAIAQTGTDLSVYVATGDYYENVSTTVPILGGFEIFGADFWDYGSAGETRILSSDAVIPAVIVTGGAPILDRLTLVGGDLDPDSYGNYTPDTGTPMSALRIDTDTVVTVANSRVQGGFSGASSGNCSAIRSSGATLRLVDTEVTGCTLAPGDTTLSWIGDLSMSSVAVENGVLHVVGGAVSGGALSTHVTGYLAMSLSSSTSAISLFNAEAGVFSADVFSPTHTSAARIDVLDDSATSLELILQADALSAVNSRMMIVDSNVRQVGAQARPTMTFGSPTAPDFISHTTVLSRANVAAIRASGDGLLLVENSTVVTEGTSSVLDVMAMGNPLPPPANSAQSVPPPIPDVPATLRNTVSGVLSSATGVVTIRNSRLSVNGSAVAVSSGTHSQRLTLGAVNRAISISNASGVLLENNELETSACTVMQYNTFDINSALPITASLSNAGVRMLDVPTATLINNSVIAANNDEDNPLTFNITTDGELAVSVQNFGVALDGTGSHAMINNSIWSRPIEIDWILNGAVTRSRSSESASLVSEIPELLLVNNILDMNAIAEAPAYLQMTCFISDSAAVEMYNNDLWSNGLCMLVDATENCVDNAVELNSCAFSGCAVSQGNIDEEPFWNSPPRIEYGSPCRNAGYDPDSLGYSVSVDFEGDLRDSDIDIGADEVLFAP